MSEGYIELVQQQPDGGPRVSVRIHVDSDMSSLINAVRQFALACGYPTKTVAEYLEDDYGG